MCIIIVKPKGKKFSVTLEEHLETAYINNPDGFGYMWNDGEHVHIRKGFMTTKAFKNELKRIRNLGKKSDVVFHSRIATHGTISKENTHPFPLSNKSDDLKAINVICYFGIAHNGVISACGYDKKGELSDTQIFIRDYLYELHPDTIMNDTVCTLIEMATKSKFAFMTPTTVKIAGDFIKEKNGCYYSNSSYKPYVYTRYTGKSGGRYTNSFGVLDNYYNDQYGTPWFDQKCSICGETCYANYNWMGTLKVCSNCSKEYFYCTECGEILLKNQESRWDGVCTACYFIYYDEAIDNKLLLEKGKKNV